MGIVAGLGGIAFYIATRVVEHYALGVWAGSYPEPHPGSEPSFAWLAVVAHPFHPWLLLLIPTLELFVENDLLVLPVVDDLKQRRVVGMVHRHEISGAYLRRVQGPVLTEGSSTL